MTLSYRAALHGLIAVLPGLLLSTASAGAGEIFVTGYGPGTIGAYTTSGATVNASLLSGLPQPYGIAVSGSTLFVAQTGPGAFTGTIGAFTTSGATVSPSLGPSGLADPLGIAVSGSLLFVTEFNSGTIGEYTTSGATVNATLILVSGLGPLGIAVSGSDLFVANLNQGTIGEYTTSGATVNAALISGLVGPTDIAVAPIPEPGSAKLLGLGLAGFGFCMILYRTAASK